VLALVRRSQKFSPAADPIPRGAGRPKFNQLEMEMTFTYKPSLVMIDARNFELLWQQTHKQTGPITIHRIAASLACSVIHSNGSFGADLAVKTSNMASWKTEAGSVVVQQVPSLKFMCSLQ